MPALTPIKPGCYTEEVPAARTITPLSTSVAVFVGYTPRGETDKAVPVSSFDEYERLFGGLHPHSDLPNS